jgi:hypothetical protein
LIFRRYKVVRPPEVERQVVEAYVEGATSEGNVKKWCRSFKEKKYRVNDEEPSGHSSLVMDY